MSKFSERLSASGAVAAWAKPVILPWVAQLFTNPAMLATVAESVSATLAQKLLANSTDFTAAELQELMQVKATGYYSPASPVAIPETKPTTFDDFAVPSVMEHKRIGAKNLEEADAEVASFIASVDSPPPGGPNCKWIGEKIREWERVDRWTAGAYYNPERAWEGPYAGEEDMMELWYRLEELWDKHGCGPRTSKIKISKYDLRGQLGKLEADGYHLAPYDRGKVFPTYEEITRWQAWGGEIHLDHAMKTYTVHAIPF